MEINQLPQLFILHYAGGNVYSFNFLKKYVEPYFEVISVELPGRGRRMSEGLIKDKGEAIRDQLKEIQKHRKIATITFPIWLYVAITGVLVYLFMQPYY